VAAMEFAVSPVTAAANGDDEQEKQR